LSLARTCAVLELMHVLHCRIRDLNDEINKLIREKGHWERRIVELGGPDYAKTAPKITGACLGACGVQCSGCIRWWRYEVVCCSSPGAGEGMIMMF
jgi:pre-mRNA-splicing factor ISY1